MFCLFSFPSLFFFVLPSFLRRDEVQEKFDKFFLSWGTETKTDKQKTNDGLWNGRGLFSRERKKKETPRPLSLIEKSPPTSKEKRMGRIPARVHPDDDDGRGGGTRKHDTNDGEREERLMSSCGASSSTSKMSKRSTILLATGCALLVAFGYVSSSSSSSTTPILSSVSPTPTRSKSMSFPRLGSSSRRSHRFEPLGEEEEKQRRKETTGKTASTSKKLPTKKGEDEEKETNALDAEIELEKDEHLLQHLQKSLNDNIETQEKETLKLVKMKVDEQDAEKMLEEEELTEEELGIHHSSHREDADAHDDGIGSRNISRRTESDDSELGFKEEDSENGIKNATKSTTKTTFEDSVLTNVSSELDEVIRDGKQSKSKSGDGVPRAAAFASMDEQLNDVLDAVHAVDGDSENNDKRNNVKQLAREKALSSSSSSSSFEHDDGKTTVTKDNPEETLGWTEADATSINPESITESAQSGVRSLVLNPEIVHDLKEKFEDMKNKGEVQVEGNWKKFDAEAKEEKKQMKEAKKMEEIVEESSKILDDIDAVRMAQSFDAGGGSKSFSWTFSYLYFPLIVFFFILSAVVALLIKTSEKNKLKRFGSTGSFDRSSPKRNSKGKLYTLEEEEIYQTKNNTYPDFSNLRDFEKGDCIYDESTESFEDEDDDTDCDNDSIDEEDDGGSYNDIYDDNDEEAFSERSSDVSSFQGFREKAIAVAKAAEEFLTNARGSSARVSNAGTFYGVSKYGANEDARDETEVVPASKKEASNNNNNNGQNSSFVKSSTTKWI